MTAKTEFLNSGVGYCYPDNNASCIKILRSAGVSALLYILSGTLVVVAIFGNLFVIIAVSHFRQLHTPTNFFVLSLAVADFLSGVLIMPVKFAAVIDYCWYLDDAVCPYHIMYGYFLLFVSVLNLVSISVDRYFAVCDPFFYNRNITNSAVGLLLTDLCVGGCFFLHYTNWWIIHNLLTYLLPMLVIICLYTKIFIEARRHFPNERKSKLSKSSERKAARTLGIVVITFIILCSPIFVFFLVGLFISISIVSMLSVQTVLIFLIAINCCIDPIIYGLFYPWFRKSLKMMLFPAASDVMQETPWTGQHSTFGIPLLTYISLGN
uniref:G-protein coupled receptors family 1 profile domain-containing protein n=1 Tax=Erpetoichthys calabaricus TaxID=27687 RepID=A0A8C4RHV4_ERPCA